MHGAEAGLGVGDGAVELRALRAEIRKGKGEEQEAEPADDPCNERSARGCDVCELPGEGEDARTDAGGDDEAHEADEADALGIIDLLFKRSHRIILSDDRVRYIRTMNVEAAKNGEDRVRPGSRTRGTREPGTMPTFD